MPAVAIPTSADAAAACDAFLDDLAAWIDGCIARHADAPINPGDTGHDQLTYTTSWATVIRHRGHAPALAFMKRQRDRLRDHMVATGFWHHGYWCEQEAHHGTEHFELFLGTLLSLDPDDPETLRQLTDAAEHFGNWVAGIPPFFDWDSGLFRSVYLGTRAVGDGPAAAINTPDHLRFVNIALLVFEHSAQQRYLDLAQAHGQRWANAITAGDYIPLALLPGGPVYDFTDEQAEAYRGFAGAAGIVQARAISAIDRAENLLASNGVEALLALWRHSGQDVYLEAVRRVLDVLVTQLHDPDAGAVSGVVRAYRDATGDGRYDDAVLTAAQQAMAGATSTVLSLHPDQRLGRGGGGVGKRADVPAWRVDHDAPRRVSPVLLALAAQIESDAELARQAVDLAHAHFQLATQSFRSGRHHGCCAQSVSAIARGHGRDNNTGMVTGVLEPVLRRLG